MSRCRLCREGMKHYHENPIGQGPDDKALVLLERWLAWARDWEDHDMRQHLVADTIALLGEEECHDY